MKQFIYKSLICLLMVISSSTMYAQGDGEPGEGDPGDNTAACKCFIPFVNINDAYGCSNMPSGNSSQCRNRNINLESTSNYFQDWRGNRGPVCRKNFVGITDKHDFTPNMKTHGNLFEIIDHISYATDPHCGFRTRSDLGSNQAVRIGDDFPTAYGVSLATTVRVERTDPFITLLYAFVLSNICGDPDNEPIFAIRVYNKTSGCNRVINLQFEMSNAANIPDLKYSADNLYGYKDWTSQVLNMENFFANPLSAYEDFTIEYVAMDCAYCVHRGYAYVDAFCGKKVIKTKPDPDPDPEDPDEPDPEDPFVGIIKCTGSNITFTTLGGTFMNETYLWDFGDGKGWSAEKEPTYFYTAAGIYNVIVKISSPGGSFDLIDTLKVKVIDCCSLDNVPKVKADNCITTFSPIEGETYILHAWVKEDITYPDGDSRIISYTKSSPHITLTFSNDGVSPVPIYCFPAGPVIDGWQRIEKEFTVPPCPGAKIDLDIALNGLASGDEGTYFDDVRIFPKKGGMKSFVYDAASQKLLAELDEENFATFYEYDQEGALIRVKKETERGIKTIKEAGNNTKKP